MKKLFVTALIAFLLNTTYSQTLYFKGEWTTTRSPELFSGLFKIKIDKTNSVEGTIVWTYLAADSSNTELVSLYKGKKGLKGIEYVRGAYDPQTRDLTFEGSYKDDPFEVIGLDKYSLKLSPDNILLYGTSDHNGMKDGLVGGRQIALLAAEQEMEAAKASLKKKQKSN